MAQSVTPPRGMRDFLPAQKRQRERLIHSIRETYAAHGFEEIETPVVEDSARLHSGLGGDNEKLAFAVMRRGLTHEHLQSAQEPLDLADLGLRFDLTVPLARFVASNRASLPSVFRAIQIAPVWRAERPQQGRFRQFIQCDIDIVGEGGITAELELLAATGDALTRLGIPDAYVRVNDRALLDAVLNAAGVAPETQGSALITLDKLDKIGVEGVQAELDALGTPGATILQLITQLRDGVVPASMPSNVLDQINQLRDAHVGVRLEFDPSLVRGMGYYTGLVFEIAHPDVPYSIGGGGRYDGLLGRFSGTEVPAVGLSLGFERLIDLVRLPEDASASVLGLVYDKHVAPALLVEIKRTLVASGVGVRLAKRSKNVSAVLAGLQSSGATEFAFVREDSTPESLEFKPLEGPSS
ncbi:histidine--tRNA ligase [Humidisolicoccus flavus]|uniref:histidine--tRNA ligase n=1 Tax=Humidisolicoccus flavus TaxID=3111414 RepID=UPI0032513632